MRAELLDRYRALALPTTRDEHWRFTSLEGFDPDAWGAEAPAAAAVPSMLDLDVAASATIDEAGIRVDGAPAGVRFEALTDDHPLLGTLVGPDDKLRAHNAAVWEHGLLVQVAAGVELEKPLYLRVASGVPRGSLFWRVLVVAEPGSRFTLVQELTSAGDDLEAYVNGVTEVVVRDGAKTEIVDVQRLSRRSWLFASCHARVERDAELDWSREASAPREARSGSRTTSPAAVPHPGSRGPTSPTARSISTTTRTSSTRRRIRRPTSRSRARCATMPPRCGAG